jgi:hypothetical protein
VRQVQDRLEPRRLKDLDQVPMRSEQQVQVLKAVKVNLDYSHVLHVLHDRRVLLWHKQNQLRLRTR